jgi:cytochrome P450
MRDATAFTVDDPRFTTAAVVGPSMLSLDGPDHQRHRRPFAPPFRPDALRSSMAAFLVDQAERLVGAFGPGPGDLLAGLAGPLAVQAIARFLGLGDVSPDQVLRWNHTIGNSITGLTQGRAPTPEAERTVETARQHLLTTLGQPDSPSMLQAIHQSGDLKPDELVSSALVVLFGAIETTEAMTANALWHILTSPSAADRLRSNRSTIGPAIEESLRHEPAAAAIDRYTTRAVRLGDVEIPRGEPVTISLLAANHDPAVFNDPHLYDPGRTNAGQHLSFVQGPHGCLGLHLARMQTEAALATLLDRCPNIALDRTRSTPPRGLVFRKPQALWARW